ERRLAETEAERREAEIDSALEAALRRSREEVDDSARAEANAEVESLKEALKRARELQEAERRAKEMVQAALQRIGKCCAGFNWIRCSGGWRGMGGSHFCSDEEVARRIK
ncbi:unnamed protein product, partial [Discosporangium mesarthrocarpum]